MGEKLENNILVLYGGGNDLSEIDKIIFESLPKNATIYFSPSAKESLKKQDEYFDFFKEYTNEQGSFNVKRLDLAERCSDQSLDFIKDADVVYFGGGNSFLLNKLMEKSKIDVVLKKQENNMVLAGYSAGAVVMGKIISPVEYMDEKISDAPESGLGLLPWSIFPHYASNDEQKRFLIESAKNISVSIMAIPDNCGMVCNGDVCKIVGKGQVEMFLTNGKTEIFTAGSIISKSYGV